MFKKILLALLVVLTPVQAWAVLDMGVQKQLASPVAESHELVASHPCHQDGADTVQHSMDNQQAIDAVEIDAPHAPYVWPLGYCLIQLLYW